MARAGVPVGDRGFWHGFGLFETVRVAGGWPCFLDRHLGRLFGSAPVLDLPMPWSPAELRFLAVEAVRRNAVREGVLRLAVTAGAGPAFDPPGPEPGLVVTAQEGLPYHGSLAEAGFRAVVSRWRRDASSPLSGVKSLNYLPSVLARREARAAGAHEALVLNQAGKLAEGAAANIFFYAGGCLHTPSLSCGVLPGITRALVMELARQLVPVEEGAYSLDDLLGAEEAFLTSSLLGVMPLVAVGGRPLGAGRPGSLTREMARRYAAAVAAEVLGPGAGETAGATG